MRISVIAALAATAVVTVAVTLTAGGVANASPALSGYQIVQSSQYSVDPNTSAETTVTCPAGMVPTSGGESNGSSGSVHLVKSSPYQNSWSTAVFNTGSTWATYSTYAVCVSGLSSYQVVWSNSLTVGANGIPTQIQAYCPSGLSIIGGGFSTGGPDNVQLYASDVIDPSGGQQDSWGVTLANRNGRDIIAQSIVVCGAGVTVQRLTQEEWISGQYTSVTAHCPAGMSLLGGGVFSISEGGTGFVWQGVITDSWPSSSTAWTAYDYPTYEGNEPSIAFDVSAICAS